MPDAEFRAVTRQEPEVLLMDDFTDGSVTNYTVMCNIENPLLLTNPVAVWLYFPDAMKMFSPPNFTEMRAGVLGGRHWRLLYKDHPRMFTSIRNDPEIPEVIPVGSGPTLAK